MNRSRTVLTSLGLSLALLAACTPPPPTAAPPSATPGRAATEFLATRVAAILTESAATEAAAAPTATATPLPPSATPPGTATATPSPTASATITPTPFPTVDLARFRRPPDTFGGDAHFFFARPIGAGGNVFVASSYRYGSTLSNQLETHHGVEFANPLGVPLVAVAPGIIYYAGTDLERQFGPQLDFYGNLVVLQLAEAWQGRPVFALYGHMDQIVVSAGQAVNAGDLLGTVGASGVALGPHLHLEVRLDNPDSYWTTRNPELWVAPGAGRGTLAVRVTNASGQYLPGRRVTIVCSDGAARFLDTYWDPGVNPDDGYGENAALTDVPAGFCELETTVEGQVLRANTPLQAGAVNFVWLRP